MRLCLAPKSVFFVQSFFQPSLQIKVYYHLSFDDFRKMSHIKVLVFVTSGKVVTISTN